MVKVPLPVQLELPVNVHVPVTAFQVVARVVVFVTPVPVPVMLSALPLFFTEKVTFAVACGLLGREVTSNVPLAVSPATGKHESGEAVRKLKEVICIAPPALTANVVSKLNRVSLAGGPANETSQLPPAAAVVRVRVAPQPARNDPSASSPTIA